MILTSRTWICPSCGSRHGIEDCEELDDSADFDDFDQYDADFETLIDFMDRGDYPGLVSYFESRIAQRPDDEYLLRNLGEACVRNGQYERAIEVLEDLHHRQPDDMDVQHTILKALFGLGKDETHFQWTEKPTVLRLGGDVVDECYRYLKPKRKPREIYELFCFALGGEFCDFTEGDLLEALRGDGRFVIEQDWVPRVRVRRKREQS